MYSMIKFNNISLLNFNFDGFLNWYNSNYYSKYCNRSPLICYCGAKEANNVENIEKYYYMIKFDEDNKPNHEIAHVRFEYIIDIIKNVEERIKIIIVITSLLYHPYLEDIQEEDIGSYSLLINFIKMSGIIEIKNELYTNIILASLTDKRLFVVCNNTLLNDFNRIHILEQVSNKISNINNMPASLMLYYEFIECIEEILEEKFVYRLTLNWKLVLENYVIYLDNNNYCECNSEYLTNLFKILSKYYYKDNVDVCLSSIINSIENIEDYTNIRKVVEDYINS